MSDLQTVLSAWLYVIQTENSCQPTGAPCKAKRCGCQAEQEMLIREWKENFNE